MNVEKRILWLDIVRVIAAFMVVFIHAMKPIVGQDSNIVYALYTYIMLPCVPLFFILSGYLLLPVNGSLFSFLKKRSVRIIFPLLFWSVINIIVKDFHSPLEVLKSLFYIPFCQRANGHYWFLYSLISIYLILPVISVWLKQARQKEIQFMLGIWLIASFLPFLNIILPDVFNGNGNYYNFLYYNAGFLGYFILGFYLKNFSHKNEVMISFLCAMIISVSHLLIILLSKLKHIDLPEMNPYLSIDVIFQSLFIFLFIRKYGNKLYFIRNVIYFLSPLTFGVYLTHGLVNKYITFPIVYNTLNLSSILAVPLSAIITFSVGVFLVYLISKIPKSKFLIG